MMEWIFGALLFICMSLVLLLCRHVARQAGDIEMLLSVIASSEEKIESLETGVGELNAELTEVKARVIGIECREIAGGGDDRK